MISSVRPHPPVIRGEFISNKKTAKLFTGVREIEGSLCITDESHYPELVSISGECSTYTSASLPKLASVGRLVVFNKNADLFLPALVSVGGYPLPDDETAERNLRRIAPLALASGALNMTDWHCETSHCVAGWAQKEILGVEDVSTVIVDGIRTLGIDAAKVFFARDEDARAFLQRYV